jgi:putative ABC transport system ATP-binding protein
MVTHEAVAASFSDRALFLADGKIVDELADPSADDVLDRIKSLDIPAPRGN